MKRRFDRKAKNFSHRNTGIPSSANSIDSHSERLTKKDMIIMCSMTVIYLIIALINLGSRNVPETPWTPLTSGESFVVDFGNKVDISRISYFCALGIDREANGEYQIQYLDEKNSFAELGALNKDNVFVWKYLDKNVYTNKLKFIVNEPGGTLNEIGFFEKDSKEQIKNFKIIDKTNNIGSVENLFDEQEKAAYLPTYLNGTYFDEIYHARTAYEHLNFIEPFENTHPPLGKLFISLGIIIFGMNPFGWRIIGTLFGVAMVPIMYLFGKKVFGKTFYAFCTAFLMMFDFMHFTQSRISTIDIYGTFFIILMYYYMFDYYVNKSYETGFKNSLKPLFLSGLFFGMGAASKWIAIYGGAGLALLFFKSRYNEYKEYKKLYKNKRTRKIPWLSSFISLNIKATMIACVLFFVIIPVIIYFLSYLPILNIPGKTNWLQEVIGYQKHMYNYHSTLKASHGFSSPWWEWPIIKKPTWFYSGSTLSGKVSTIATMGNPAIWWTGIITVFTSLFIAISKKDKKMFVIFIAITFQYVPWVLVPRITWIYHFFSTIPFVILSIVYMIKYLLEKYPGLKYGVYAYLAVVAILFIVFYPVISGFGASQEYINGLKWFRSWVF